MAPRIVVMAGGTGGHVFPALAVAQELQARGWEVSWLGTPQSFESRVVPDYGFPLDTIPAYRLRGQGPGSVLLAPARLLKAMGKAYRVLAKRRPQVVLGMGGFVTGPGGIVSRLMGLPLIIHEQNSIPGLTNRWLAKIARQVLAAFPGSFKDQAGVKVTGNPLRTDITRLAEPQERMGDHQDELRLLIMGGSLGAQALNEIVPESLALLDLHGNLVVRHQAGKGKKEATESHYQQVNVNAEVSEFLVDMAEAYAWADLVICRAGALTVSELAAVGVASVLVPFPHAVDDHQTHNAEFLVQAGAGLLIQQSDLTAQSLANTLKELLSAPGELLAMAKHARGLAKPDATKEVADCCEQWGQA